MSEIKKFYTTLTAIPRPKVGDRFYRTTLVKQYEEALIVSMLSQSEDSENWSATLMTKNGLEQVSGNVEHRSIHDWMPVGWRFDATLVGWIPPESVLRDDSKDAADIEDPVEAEAAAKVDVFVVPAPWEGEKFMSWRSRVLKSVPALKGKRAIQSKLSDSWKSKQYEITI
tara:strand:+ start:8105 stop:8614 length:510 start_codon:yes stop_codon:yes gene_type:complete